MITLPRNALLLPAQNLMNLNFVPALIHPIALLNLATLKRGNR